MSIKVSDLMDSFIPSVFVASKLYPRKLGVGLLLGNWSAREASALSII
jgi:hypothetical protein